MEINSPRALREFVMAMMAPPSGESVDKALLRRESLLVEFVIAQSNQSYAEVTLTSHPGAEVGSIATFLASRRFRRLVAEV